MNKGFLVAGLAGVALAAVGCSSSGSNSSGTSGSGGSGTSTVTTTGVTASTTTATTATTTSSSSGGGWTASCNPVTNEPCAAGEACDASNNDTFQCFPPPNDANVCGMCDNMNGPFCKGGHGCAAKNGCAKYCCDDGDCGTGTCVKTNGENQPLWPGVDVGVCLDAMGNAACDAPGVPPSNGACITVQ